MAVEIPDKPLRADAERNRRRILDAARELFAERGLGVTLNDVAHHAGVGVGTVYRRFPDKATLVGSLFEEAFAQILERMEIALADPDPWHGLVTFLERQLEAQQRDRGLRQLLTEAPEALEHVFRMRDALLPKSAELVARARAQGALREDVEATDLAVVQLMLGAVLDASHDVEPALARRCLGLLLRGLSARPESLPPLAAPAIAEEKIGALMTNSKAVRR